MPNTKMNFFEQLFYSVIKPKQYYRLTKVSGGRLTGFVFLFLFLISLFSILPMLSSTLGAHGFIRTLQEELPDFELSGGELYVSERYEVDENNSYVLIDTTVDRFTYEDIDEAYDQVVLVSRTNMLNYRSYGRIQEINFDDLLGFHMNNATLNKIIPLIYPIIILIAVFIYLFVLAAYYVTALLYSLVGLFVSYVSHANLTYATIFKTAIYSKVTIRILYALLDITSLSIPGYLRYTIAIVVTGAYLVFGILSHTSTDAYEEAGIPLPPRNN
ncbi:MAG: hypothetical protein K0R92_3647 [Lachnospiraceae bacterium]|jgi:hypothetical protein|nr:hypothetical protein [Lachnospiraceae bacterium]